MKITNTTVNKLTPPESGYRLEWDSDLRGFGVRVTAAGAKSYIAQAKVNGKTRRVTLGRHGTITADKARNKAKIKLGRMADGTDLSAEKQHQKALSVTLREVAEDYKENRRTAKGLPLKDSTKADIEKHLCGIFSDWQKRPIVKINRELVQRRYSEHCKRSVAQANQAMRVLRALINYAAAKYRDPEGNPIILDNPVKVLRDASILRGVKARTNAVPLEKVGGWWSAVQTMRNDPALTTVSKSAADLIALLALTGLRVGEARSLKWSQIDLDGESLELTDTKNRESVTLPLSGPAAAIIRERGNDAGYVFPARSGKGHINDVRGQLERLAEETGITVTAHDIRRTFRAVAAACNVELWRTKALMNHKQNHDVTLANYTDLSDVRYLKPEADRIAAYFEDQRRVFEADNVVSMEGKRA
ncbi:tyrosine-type recombinase/integrase [Wenzhouxiangella sp. XN201]|uniref:tyrosine-type recombinase/integrase n=1 Tax=Wenzhouxiangella sp. XN201 TaxID=2710755 RepID=UPI0013C81517|nr:tyrosine-type recombinase/integrase [Wenzhouxiangella sp. XN201]NEZ03781.1 tyrosine-type recombinase/integrase [Wenzhouxiangella sp. XN201]